MRINPERFLELLLKIQSKNPNIIFADIQDSTAIQEANIINIVKLYAKSQVLKQRELYQKPIYSFRIYCEYMNNTYGTQDNGDYSEPIKDTKNLNKIHILWNSSLADYRWLGPYRMIIYNHFPLKYLLNFPQSNYFTSANKDRKVPVTCRVGTKYHRGTITKHRQDVLTKLNKFIEHGKLPRKAYLKEIKNNRIAVSPFGLGEITLRDFEIFMGGALLFKPNMDHMETWPNLYKAFETYIPFKWDLSDLNELIEYYLENEMFALKIAAEGQNTYRRYICSSESALLFSEHFGKLCKKALT